jgi:hypothetical protein
LPAAFTADQEAERTVEEVSEQMHEADRAAAPIMALFGLADGLDTEGFMSRPCDKAGRYFAPASIRRLRENGVRS